MNRVNNQALLALVTASIFAVSLFQPLSLAEDSDYSYPANIFVDLENGDIITESSIISITIQNEELPKVTIIHTGGTIASKVDYATGAVIARFEPEELLSSIPELMDIANIEAVKLGNMWSDDIRPQHWNKMIDASKKAFDDGCDGIVITHGTDTLHITSAALNFAWAGKGQVPPVCRILILGNSGLNGISCCLVIMEYLIGI